MKVTLDFRQIKLPKKCKRIDIKECTLKSYKCMNIKSEYKNMRNNLIHILRILSNKPLLTLLVRSLKGYIIINTPISNCI